MKMRRLFRGLSGICVSIFGGWSVTMGLDYEARRSQGKDDTRAFNCRVFDEEVIKLLFPGVDTDMGFREVGRG